MSQTIVERTYVIRNGNWEPGPNTEGLIREGADLELFCYFEKIDLVKLNCVLFADEEVLCSCFAYLNCNISGSPI